MFRKASKIVLASALLLSTVSPSLAVYAEVPKVATPPATETAPATTEQKSVTGTTTDTQPQTTGNIGLAASTATNLHREIQKTLISLGGTGEPISAQFAEGSKKAENTKIFNNVILTQLELYELLYVTGIKGKLEAPVKAKTLDAGVEINNLDTYLIGYNIINEFLNTQIATLEATDGFDESLVAALKSAKIDMKEFQADTITQAKPLTTEVIRTKLQALINKSTAQALSAYMMYLNKGKGSDDISALSKADTKDSTKEVLALIRQWNTLPHIAGATDAMKLLGITNVNQEWLTALQSMLDDMEKDTGGSTDPNAGDSNDTSPELATSVLGRLGSSLFTVKRSDHADDNKDKPLTNTLGWTLDEKKKKSDDTFDPGPAAKDDFLAMFAATAMYTPFVSRVGDKDYVEAFKALFNDSADQIKDDDEKVRFEGNALGPIDILSQVQNLKKPLYFYDDLNALGTNTVYGHSVEDVKGVASLLTVGDLINTIKGKKDLAAITMHGVMAQDGDSWSFYNYTLNIDGQVETTADEDSGTPVANAGTVVAGEPIVNKIHADKTINGGQENTRVVFEMTYNDKNPGAGYLTGALMHNIYNDTLLKSKFTERASEAVYLDAVGNIVLNDGLVVLPASANPTYWSMPNGLEGSDYETEAWTYNPFTVAFMDTYPAIYQGGTAPSSVNQKKDKNKYILSSYGFMGSGVVVSPLKKGFKSSFTVSQSAGLYTKFKLEGITEPVEDIPLELEGSIGVDDKQTAAEKSWRNIGATKPIQLRNVVTADGDSLFPYLTTQVTDPFGQEAFDTSNVNYKSAIHIAKNMYAYIIGEVDSQKTNTTAADGKSAGGSSIGLLREGFLFNNVTMPILTGITNGVEFDKTNAKSDLLRAGGDSNIAEKWILNLSKWLAVTTKESVNILSISNSDDVSLLKVLYGALIDYGYYIIFILLMVLLVIFLREGDFMAAALKGGVIMALLFLTLFIIPLAVPWVTGVTSSPLTKGTVLNSLMTKLEMSEKVNSVEPAGQSGLSVKLYNMSPKQTKELNDQYLTDKGNYLTNTFSINDNLGMFVDGTELRLDLYSFWRFDPLIIATADNVTAPNEKVTAPQIYHSDHSKSELMADNSEAKNEMGYNNELIDYYMPFNLIENGFMKTLNTYLIYYDPPQSIVRYPDGLVKSSYVMNTYMKSLAFLAAEPSIAELISSAESPDDYAQRGLNESEVNLVNQMFYPYGDILNLQPWVESELEELPTSYANSVWTQSMIKAGYYAPGSGIEKRVELANKVNRKAYDTIIHMKDTKGMVSDESLIKLVSLYATFEFNKAISYVGHNVYPRTANLNEFSASDIMAATVLGQSKQFLFYDTSVISNVYSEKGVLGVAAVDLALIALALYSIFLSWILPTMIIGLLGYSIYLILTNRRITPALVFTFKLTMLAIIMNLALVLAISGYQLYDSMYLFTLLLLVIDSVFGWLFWRLIFRRKSRLDKSWQRKHLNNMGGNGRSNNSQTSLNMQDYLRESEGAYGRRATNSSRYDD